MKPPKASDVLRELAEFYDGRSDSAKSSASAYRSCGKVTMAKRCEARSMAFMEAAADARRHLAAAERAEKESDHAE